MLSSLNLYALLALILYMAEKKKSPYQRVSPENMDRVENGIGKFGESLNDVFGRLLDLAEDVKRCLAEDVPQTEELRELMYRWKKEAIIDNYPDGVPDEAKEVMNRIMRDVLRKLEEKED